MENKITEEELKNIKSQHELMDKLVLDIGVIETKKHALLHHVAEVNKQIDKLKGELHEKYGEIQIDMEDGSYALQETKEEVVEDV